MNVEAENNSRAVTISEEIDFFEELLKEVHDPEGRVMIVERRDELRAAMQTAEGGNALDSPVEGFSPGPEVELMESEAYDTDDDVDEDREDEDHEFVSDRAGKCQVCGQPEEACTEEP